MAFCNKKGEKLTSMFCHLGIMPSYQLMPTHQVPHIGLSKRYFDENGRQGPMSKG